MLIAVAGAVLTAVSWSGLHLSDALSNLASSAAAAGYATLGALIVRRVRNPVGWLLLAAGAGTGPWLSFLPTPRSDSTHTRRAPGGRAGRRGVRVDILPGRRRVRPHVLLFPSGTLPSRRWRPVVALNLLATGLLLTAFAVVPRRVALPAPGGVSLTYENPFGIPAAGHALSAVPVQNFNTFTLITILFLAAASVSLVCATGRVAPNCGGRSLGCLGGAAFALLQLVALVAIVADHGKIPVIATVAYEGTAAIALFGLPAVITIGILKYRLYEIDVIINRAVVYGLVSAGLTGVYAGIVLGIGALAGRQGSAVLTVTAAVAVALLFQPVRQRARRVANRLVYGDRATPYQVLADFAQDMAGQLDADAALDRMASMLASATGAVRVEVWVRVGPELRPQVTWPHGSIPPAAVPVASGASCPPSTRRHGRSRSGTGLSCSARSPSANRGTSR